MHNQLTDNILANDTEPEHCQQFYDINAQQETGTCLLTFHPDPKLQTSHGIGECNSAHTLSREETELLYKQDITYYEMSKGEVHTLLINNADLHAPGMHATELCRAYANDNMCIKIAKSQAANKETSVDMSWPHQ